MSAMAGWLDTNVLLRFFLNDHPTQSPRARMLIAAAEKGFVVLKVPSHVTCEVVYILESKGYGAADVANVLRSFSLIDGIEFAESQAIFEALIDYRDHKVDFADALTAALARNTGEKVWTFDAKHFKRLNVIWAEPGPLEAGGAD
ncbi:MAG: PIN domain-containing protein [Firmicutes bacterium]|nr:PIN domain-containing protein [Bacillota bacterium]